MMGEYGGRRGCSGGRERGSGRGAWGFDPDVMSWMWGGASGGRGRGGRGGGGRGGRRGGRMFGQGDLKFVILQLLEEKPRHGYEVIKELEQRCGGAYVPSPGTVYPTLSLLEDMGYARAHDDGGGRKVYTITDEGRAYLADHQDTVEDIFDRLANFGANLFGGPMMDVHQSMREVARATYAQATRHPGDTERLGHIVEILQRAAVDIDAVRARKDPADATGAGQGTTGGSAPDSGASHEPPPSAG